MRDQTPAQMVAHSSDIEAGGGNQDITETHADVKRTALHAAAAASADQLAEIRRDIAELEAQVEMNAKQGGLQPVLGLGASVLGVLALFLLFGILQEWIIKREFGNTGGWFVSLVQCALCAGFSISRGNVNQEPRKAPFSYYLILGFLQVACVGISNVAVQSLNYPTYILCKSSAPIPSLLIGAFCRKKRYGLADYIATLAMLAGIAIFVIADAQTIASQPDVKGFVLVSFALISEVCITPVQDKIRAKFNAPPEELALYTHLVGAFYLLIIALLSGDLTRGILLSRSSPRAAAAIVLFAGCGFFGEQTCNMLGKLYGGMAELLAATFRKSFAILLSVLLFPKPFNSQYLCGLASFVAGSLLSSSATKIRLRALLGTSLLGRVLQLEPKRKAANTILR